MTYKNLLNCSATMYISLMLCFTLQTYAMEQEKAKYAYIGKLISKDSDDENEDYFSSPKNKISEIYKIENQNILVEKCLKNNKHHQTEISHPDKWKITMSKNASIKQETFDNAMPCDDFIIEKGQKWYEDGMPHYDTSGNLCVTDKDNNKITTCKDTGIIYTQYTQDSGMGFSLKTSEPHIELLFPNSSQNKWITVQEDKKTGFVVLTATDGDQKKS